MKSSFLLKKSGQNSNDQELTKYQNQLTSNLDKQFKTTFKVMKKHNQDKTMLVYYNLFGKSFKIQEKFPQNYSEIDDLKFLFTKLGFVLAQFFKQKTIQNQLYLKVKSNKNTSNENYSNLNKKSIEERQKILNQLIYLENSLSSCQNKKITLYCFPQISKQKNKLLNNFEIFEELENYCFLKQFQQINKKQFSLKQIAKLLSSKIKIKKNSLSINKWIFINFLPIIHLRDLQNIKSLEFNLFIKTTKHKNIEIGITPSDTTIQFANSCSIHRISFHLRNLEMFDNFQNLDSTQSNKWKKNPLGNTFQKDQNINIKVRILKNKSEYRIIWIINGQTYAKSIVSQYLIDNGFKFCVGMFHVDDCITTNYTLNKIQPTQKHTIPPTDQESQAVQKTNFEPQLHRFAAGVQDL